jgi:hypothetical protein
VNSQKDYSVSELDLAKLFYPASQGKVFAGERVTLIIDDEFGGLCFQFKLTKEEIAELIKEDK